jgi:hypothetical protein
MEFFDIQKKNDSFSLFNEKNYQFLDLDIKINNQNKGNSIEFERKNISSIGLFKPISSNNINTRNHRIIFCIAIMKSLLIKYYSNDTLFKDVIYDIFNTFSNLNFMLHIIHIYKLSIQGEIFINNNSYIKNCNYKKIEEINEIIKNYQTEINQNKEKIEQYPKLLNDIDLLLMDLNRLIINARFELENENENKNYNENLINRMNIDIVSYQSDIQENKTIQLECLSEIEEIKEEILNLEKYIIESKLEIIEYSNEIKEINENECKKNKLSLRNLIEVTEDVQLNAQV